MCPRQARVRDAVQRTRAVKCFLARNYIPGPMIKLRIQGVKTMLSVLINNEISCMPAENRKKGNADNVTVADCPRDVYPVVDLLGTLQKR